MIMRESLDAAFPEKSALGHARRECETYAEDRRRFEHLRHERRDTLKLTVACTDTAQN